MGFWDTSDGEDVKSNTTGEFDAGGGNMGVIPDNTSVLAVIDEAKWDKNQSGDRFVSLRWSVLQPEEFANRKVFQKLWCGADADPRAKDADKKRDKAKRMLAAIDMNAGGKLLAKPVEPTDEMLTSCLTNKPMVIKVMVWDMRDPQTGDIAQGNWVGAVAPKSAPRSTPEEIARNEAAMAKRPQPRPASGGTPAGNRSGGGMSSRDMDDEIPFMMEWR